MIVDSQSGRFLKTGGGWTLDECEAASFDNVVILLEECRRAAVKHPQVLLRFEDKPDVDIRLPLDS